MSVRVLGLETETAVPGYFGKVRSRGDFVSRRLPQSFLGNWDGWLQSCLVRSREQLGEAWLDIYLTSPLWRFVLSCGVCSESGWAGILLPSVDRVGRYFPFTLVVALTQQQSPIAMLDGQWVKWFSEAEPLALSCLEEDFDLDAFDARLAALEAPRHRSRGGTSEGNEVQRSAVARRLAWRHDIASALSPATGYPPLLERLLEERMGEFSLWWTDGSECVAPSLLVSEGLPPVDGFASMLDGRWRDWGWEDRCGGLGLDG